MGEFRFKQFTVNDDGCAMKVGTDGVLLGAWCEVSEAKQILDIGSGSGVIALMMAQRSIADAHIDAVEMLPDDALRAKENVRVSPWPEKISVIQTRVQDFQATAQYDLIVCNPPYFVKSLQPPDARRAAAKHNNSLTHDELIEAALRLLLPSGKFHLILPQKESLHFREEASSRGLHLVRLTHFFTRTGKPEQRSLMTFTLLRGNLAEGSLLIYGPNRKQTEEYSQLTREFYL